MSLLTALSTDLMVRDPFPHLVVEEALDPELCEQLTREFPSVTSFVRGRELPENKKIVRRNTELLADVELTDAWRHFIEEHLHPSVLQEWMRLMGADLLQAYPDFVQRFGDPDLMRVGRRSAPDAADCDVVLDAALVAHTPVISGCKAERGPHLKEPNKPFLGFLFLRPEEDVAEGAEIELYAPVGVDLQCTARNQFDPSTLRVVKRIPYRSNTLLLMLNTPGSITTHAARASSQVPMQYFHLLAELPDRLFELPRETSS